MNNQEITLSNFRRFYHRLHKNAKSAESYTSNLRHACERAVDYRYPSFTELGTSGEVLDQLCEMVQRGLLSGNYRAAVRKYAAYLATFCREAA